MKRIALLLLSLAGTAHAADKPLQVVTTIETLADLARRVGGDRVEVRASSHVSHFVHVQDRAYFYRTLMERLRWRVAIGTVKYLRSEETGIFAQGGPWRPLAGLALEYRVPLTDAFDLRLVGRADVHSFTTDELSSRGFGASQWSRNESSHARHAVSCSSRPSKCAARCCAPGISIRSWPRVVQRHIMAWVTSMWNCSA